MTARWFAVIVVAAALALPAQALVQEKKDEAATDKPDKKDLPLEGSRTIAFTTDEGSWMSLDVSPGWQDDRVRVAGRPLQPATLGRRGEADYRRHGVRQSAALLARWVEDYVPQRSQRRRQRLDGEGRRHRPEGDHQGEDADVPIAGVDA